MTPPTSLAKPNLLLRIDKPIDSFNVSFNCVACSPDNSIPVMLSIPWLRTSSPNNANAPINGPLNNVRPNTLPNCGSNVAANLVPKTPVNRAAGNPARFFRNSKPLPCINPSLNVAGPLFFSSFWTSAFFSRFSLFSSRSSPAPAFSFIK